METGKLLTIRYSIKQTAKQRPVPSGLDDWWWNRPAKVETLR